MAKTVLITGAYGFIGRNAALCFARQGWTVIGVGHGVWNREEWESWGISEWHTSDITLNVLFTYANEPDAIVHCAGSGSVGFSMTHPLQDYQRTVETTLSVLEFSRLNVPKIKIVFPSSAGVYGNSEAIPIKETTPLNPVSPYGVHKKIAEELCSSYARNFGMSVSIVRFFSVYGAGLRKQLLWDACLKLKKNDSTFFGGGTEKRDWLHINDAVRLLFKAVEHASEHCPIVNGGSGKGISVKEILEEFFLCLNRTDMPFFSGANRAGDPKHYIANIDQARKWSWQPEVNWKKGIREYVEWIVRGGYL